MADLILKVCDMHMTQDERVDASPHSITVDGKEYLIDTCDGDWRNLTDRLLETLVEVGRLQGKTGRPGTPTECTDPNCSLVFDSKAQMRKHVRQLHKNGGATKEGGKDGATEPVEEGDIACGVRGCKRKFTKTNGKFQHWRQAHKLDKEGRPIEDAA